ncbi:nucleocapsid protein [Arceuthobium sichuanense virus 1]|uniref:Nucleocapsid protein n=1 Tax=Arceuthobium sichuanense-associated virus 1 TaxID=3070160 RepID=A0AA48SEQ8_9VIRU|nr:nucleocapsid protein [Arceuthobium sichuanense virus 1]DAZ87274.1 TPA_asm: nucleocapsid protein [Arceuthobium sichuanense-associated virus 1]
MASKDSKAWQSDSSSNGSVVVDGKAYNINDVKNGITNKFSNSHNLVPYEPVLVNFDQLNVNADSFKLTECISSSNFRLEVAYKCITNSKAMSDAKKAGKIQKIQLSDVTYFIVPKVKPGAIKNVISYNRFMAICIAAIRLNLTKQKYNWDNHQYSAIKEVKTLNIPDGVGNRLALACGFDSNHDLYWFYASGFEFTFELFPVEVICCVMMRLANKDEFNLSKLGEEDIVKNLAAQIGKKGPIESIIKDIGFELITETYKKYMSNRSELISTKRIKDALGLLQELLQKTG